MANLIATPPFGDTLPVTVGATTITERPIERAASVAPFAGRAKAVSAALKQAIGLGLTGPGEWAAKGEASVIWFGRDTWLVIGAEVPESLQADAAVTDQSDAWACLRIDGPQAEAALARLVPLDLRAAAFGTGRTARSLIGHMSASITRAGGQGYDLMVMRSMARTLAHEVAEALQSVAARGA